MANTNQQNEPIKIQTPWMAMIVHGTLGAVAIATAALLMHFPGLTLPIWSIVAVLTATLAAVLFRAGSHHPESPLRVGLGAGIVASALFLVMLGSVLAGDAAPNPAVVIATFVGTSAILGAIAARAGAALAPRPSDRHPVSCMTRIFIAALAPLLIIGGVVTSTESALAVPDWPGTYGKLMFLYPLAQMANPRVFFEHAHRLFGSMAGLTAILLLIVSIANQAKNRSATGESNDRSAMRFTILALAILALVIFQGVLGGFRVTEQSQSLAAAHGVLAQLVLALAAGFAAFTSVSYRTAPLGPQQGTKSLRAWSTALIVILVVQLSMGAVYRHMGTTHALWTHIGLSLFVVIVAILTGALARRAASPEPLARSLHRLGHWLFAVVGIQFLLGWGALGVVMAAKGRGPIPTSDMLESATAVPPIEALLTTVHQANGALLFGLAAATVVLVRAGSLTVQGNAQEGDSA